MSSVILMNDFPAVTDVSHRERSLSTMHRFHVLFNDIKTCCSYSVGVEGEGKQNALKVNLPNHNLPTICVLNVRDNQPCV